jgi:hypothetical protein
MTFVRFMYPQEIRDAYLRVAWLGVRTPLQQDYQAALESEADRRGMVLTV